MNNKVYIILLNYNGWKDTIECLESVLKSDYVNYQIVVVDNDSPNNSMEYIINWARGKQKVVYDDNSQLKHLSQPFEPKPLEYVYYTKNEAISGGDREKKSKLNNPIIFIQSGENGGFAAGNNIGIKYALEKNDFEYIWLLNNDTVIKKDSLSNLVKKFETYKKNEKKISILGLKLLYYDNPDIIQGIGGIYNKHFAVSKHLGDLEKDKGQYDSEKVLDKIDYVIGASMLLSKDFVKEIGLMCEDYFLYFEEMDWILRGKMKGYYLGYCWQSEIYHKKSSSTVANLKTSQKSKFVEYYALKNRILFTKKFYPEYLWSVYMGFLVIFWRRIKRKQFDRLSLVVKVLMGK